GRVLINLDEDPVEPRRHRLTFALEDSFESVTRDHVGAHAVTSGSTHAFRLAALDHVLGKVGGDVAGTHGDYVDVVALELHTRRHSDSRHGMLGRAVSAHVGSGNVSGDGRDVHDIAAALPAHHRNRRLDALDGPEQVRFEHLPELREVHLLDGVV